MPALKTEAPGSIPINSHLLRAGNQKTTTWVTSEVQLCLKTTLVLCPRTQRAGLATVWNSNLD